MIKIIWFVFENVVNLFQTYVLSWSLFNTLTYKLKVNKKYPLTICTLLLFIICTLFNYRTDFEGIGIFAYIIVMFIISLIYFSDNILKKLILCILPISFVAVSSALSINILSVAFKVSAISLMSEQNSYRVITVIIGNIIFFILVCLLNYFIKREDLTLTKIEWLFMGSVLTISIIVLLLIYLAIFRSEFYELKIILSCAMIGIIAINITIYVLLMQLSKKQQIVLESTIIKREYHHQKEFTSALKGQYDQLQRMHHDFSNTLLVIQTLNNEQKYDSINNYITKYIEENKNTLKFVTTNNDYVNAVINSKIALAKNNNINVTFNIYTEIPDINQVDLCNLLNNMFDNAIEACNKCIDNKEISLEIRCDKMSLNFFIKNSIPHSVFSSNPELDTDKKDRKHHGFGTKIIKDIAAKHHGYADFYEENGMFCCNVILNTDTIIENIEKISDYAGL